MRLPLLILLVFGLVACDSKSAEPDTRAAAADASAQVRVDASVERAERDSTEPNPSETPGPLELSPPLRHIPRDFTALEEELESAEPVGTIRGQIFDDAELLGMVREECGEGAILQPIFRQKGELRVGTPIRLPLFHLATREPVQFEDRIFEIDSKFEEDSAERLAGRLAITYQSDDGPKTFIEFEVDTRPMRGLLEPRLDGEGKLPSYPRCTPTGYARVEADERTSNFLVHTMNVDEKGVPWVWVVLRDSTVLQLMVIPPKPDTEIEGLESPLGVAAARDRDSRPAVVIGKFLHSKRIVPDAEATSENRVPPIEASLLDGSITELSLVKESGEWRLRMKLEQIMITEMLGSDLAGRTIDSLQIDTFLAPPNDLEPRLGDRPDWWEKDDE